MSCSARLPVYVLFATALLPSSVPVVFTVRFGVVLAMAVSKALSFILRPDGSSAFVMELPPPDAQDVSGPSANLGKRQRVST